MVHIAPILGLVPLLPTIRVRSGKDRRSRSSRCDLTKTLSGPQCQPYLRSDANLALGLLGAGYVICARLQGR